MFADGFWPDATQVMKEQVKRVGFDLDLILEEFGGFIARADQGDFDLIGIGRANMVPDPDDSFASAYLEGSKNWSRLVDPLVTELWNKQTRELDPVKRRELNYVMQRHILNGAPGYVGWAWGSATRFVSKRIKTVAGQFVPHPSLYTQLKHEHEWLEPEQ